MLELRPVSATRQVSSRRRVGLADPKFISFVIVALALYGDLAKRFLEPSIALITLYAASCAVLAAMIARGSDGRKTKGTLLSTLAGLLIAIYLAQLVTSFSVDLIDAITAVAYISVPLSFVLVIPRFYPQFDLRALAYYTTVLMIPVHAVGLIQEFVSPSFMISSAYSETGGIIERNFLDAGAFSRYPSIFASADRYSGVAMMQIYLSFVLLSGSKPPTRKMFAWVALSLVAGFSSLLIAGARSRIIIVSITLLVAGVAFLIAIVRGKLTPRKVNLALGLFLILAIVLVAALSRPSIRERVTSFPVLAMLEQTIDEGDVRDRFMESIELSVLPDDVSFFGEGLGVTGAGRPGEFGVRAMWIESGLFWTPIMLLIHAGILFWLGRTALRVALSGEAVLALVTAGQMLAWLLGLLAGLSGTFELSQALLLFPIIAVFSMIRLGRSAHSRNLLTTSRPNARSPEPSSFR